jgi:toxin secretion/phage lysis holin
MEFPERLKSVAGTVAVAAGVIGLFLAHVPKAVLALWLLMGLDILTGYVSAGIRGELSSEVSRQGIERKIQTLLMVATAWVIESFLPIKPPMSLTSMVALFYCANEGLSILENVAEAGVPVPRVLRNALARLKNDQESDGNGASRDNDG